MSVGKVNHVVVHLVLWVFAISKFSILMAHVMPDNSNIKLNDTRCRRTGFPYLNIQPYIRYCILDRQKIFFLYFHVPISCYILLNILLVVTINRSLNLSTSLQTVFAWNNISKKMWGTICHGWIWHRFYWSFIIPLFTAWQKLTQFCWSFPRIFFSQLDT